MEQGLWLRARDALQGRGRREQRHEAGGECREVENQQRDRVWNSGTVKRRKNSVGSEKEEMKVEGPQPKMIWLSG